MVMDHKQNLKKILLHRRRSRSLETAPMIIAEEEVGRTIEGERGVEVTKREAAESEIATVNEKRKINEMA